MGNNLWERHTQLIIKEFEKYFSLKPDDIKILSGGASGKLIHRIFIDDSSYIGIYNDDIPENLAFIGFTKSFASVGLNVPKVYHFSEDKKIYFLNDLGDVTLHKFLLDTKNEKERMKFNRKALDNLLKFQVKGRDIIDFRLCYQSPAFDLAQIQIDEQKFIRYYLPHNKKKTNSEIISVALDLINDKVLSEDEIYFMYRDFQPRNIIVKDSNLFFIDYQSGRKGPLLYDLASYIYSGSIFLSEEERTALKEHYISELDKSNIRIKNIEEKWEYIVLIRLIQMLGSYALSYQEKKEEYYKTKIVSAIKNLRTISEKTGRDEIKKFSEQLEYYS